MLTRARGAALICAIGCSACTLTESLDDLRGRGATDAGADSTTGGAGGSGGAWPDGGGGASGAGATAGSVGSGGAGTGGSGGTGGSSGTGGGGTTGGSGGTSSCGSTEKLCANLCVSLDDPDYGCAGPSCDNCSLSHATETCSGGECAILSCSAGWGDCNGSDSDGCETDLDTNPNHCGSCGVSCAIPNGSGSCTNGGCNWQCTPPYGDCDGILANGCEQNLNFCSCSMSCTPCATCCVTPGVCLQCSC